MHYDNPACTGLGDRLGIILSLSALALLHNSSSVVHMEWCTQPERAVMRNPQFMQWIPKWTGYNFPIALLQATLTLPDNIRIYPSGQSLPAFDTIVRKGGEVPAWSAIALTNTMYCKAVTIIPHAEHPKWTTRECVKACKQAGSQLLVSYCQLSRSNRTCHTS